MKKYIIEKACYKIEDQEQNRILFEEEINILVSKNYEPNGNISISHVRDFKDDIFEIIVQSLIYKEPPETISQRETK